MPASTNPLCRGRLGEPDLGAWGLGWEVWLDGMEVSQFTYFQQVGGIECDPVSTELTYGLERWRCMPRGSKVYTTSITTVLGGRPGDQLWPGLQAGKTANRRWFFVQLRLCYPRADGCPSSR